MRTFTTFAVTLMLLTNLSGQTSPTQKRQPRTSSSQGAQGAAAGPVITGTPVAVIDTSAGQMRCTLYPDKAPKGVENFIGLALGTKEWTDPKTEKKKRGVPLYNGTIFHRVIPNFMIQGGDPLGTGTGGPGYRFEDEVSGGPKFDGPGYLAMANAGPNTNGSQFFITTVATPWLTGKHTIFGEVVEGMEVVDAIAGSDRDARDRPLEDLLLDRVVIEQQD